MVEVVPFLSGLTAAGTSIGTAFDLNPLVGYNQVTTVAAGTGVQLPPGVTGQVCVIQNAGANALLVYPQPLGVINSLAAGVGFSLGVNMVARFTSKDGLNWISLLSSSGGSGIPLRPTLSVSAATTLVPAQSGTTVYLNTSGTAYTVTLPTPAFGLNFRFICSTAAEASIVTITAGSAIMFGGSIANDATAVTSPLSATKTTLFRFTATCVVGDKLDVEADPLGTSWICNSQSALHGATNVA